MTTETLTRSNTETWRDWLLPGQESGSLISREELAEELAQYDIKPVSANDLRYWEAIGVIPKSIKQRHDGATRAVYPKWMVSAILLLRIMQDSGHSLEKIAETIRLDFRKNIDHPEFGRSAKSQGLNGRHVVQLEPVDNIFLPRLIQSQISRVLENHGIQTIGYIDIQIFGEDGKTVASTRYVPGVDERSAKSVE